MKYLLLTSTLTLSLMFSAGSWAEWTEVTESALSGSKNYVDLDRIRKVDGLVYFWLIEDLLEPFNGDMSYKVYYKADCETLQDMALSFSTYKLSMAKGDATSTFTPEPKWVHAEPDTVKETTLQAVCAH